MDIEAFRTTGRLEAAEKRLLSKLPRPIKGELFIKGPIPMGWLSKAAGLPGKSLHVALAAWFKCAIEGNGASLPRSALKRFGVGPRAGRQAMARLHAAGLLQVVMHRGRAPVVTVLDAEPQEAGGTG